MWIPPCTTGFVLSFKRRNGEMRVSQLKQRAGKGLLIALVSLALFGAAHPAEAHVFLKSSQPAANQVIVQAPAQVVLTFSDSVTATGNTITVTDAAGSHVDKGDSAQDSVNPAVVKVSLNNLPAGVYTVAYHVVSAADGHVTEDSFKFGVGAVTLTNLVQSRACAQLPAVTPSPDITVSIVSPPDNSTITGGQLAYSVKTDNYNLGSNGNYADVWVDGQRTQKIDSIREQSLTLTDGIHNICVSLVDGPTSKEVGARAGIRVLVQGATGQQAAPAQESPSQAPLIAVIGAVIVVIVVVAAVIMLRRRKPRPTG